ncbi:radical SAM protein, partial [Rhizobium leguminosarum]
MRRARDIVFFINPPNSDDVFTEYAQANTVTKGVQHTDWANFPHLGILSLASYIDAVPGLKGRYIDGVIHAFDAIIETVSAAADGTLAVCLSAITANYESAIRIAEAVRHIDPDIAIVMGNDHFTAMNEKILPRHR